MRESLEDGEGDVVADDTHGGVGQGSVEAAGMGGAPVIVIATATADGTKPPGTTGAGGLRGVGRCGVLGCGRFTAIRTWLVNCMPRGHPAIALSPVFVVAPTQRRSVVINRHIFFAEHQRVARTIRNVGDSDGLPGRG